MNKSQCPHEEVKVEGDTVTCVSCGKPCNLYVHTSDVEQDLILICAWSPEKESFEEGVKALEAMRGRILEVTHGICHTHLEEFKSLTKPNS